MSELVRRSDTDGAAVLTLDSPHNRNALSRRLVDELLALLQEAAADPAVRTVVVTGAGRTFCAGADLSDPPVSGGRGSYTDVLRTLWEYPKPVVIAINGHVRAGGFGMVAAGDIVVCAESATFAFTETRIGVVPAIISVLCLRRMTPLAASRYLLSGEQFGPDDARLAGLVTSVVPDDRLGAAVAEVAAGFRLCEPTALRVTREMIRRVPQMDTDAGFEWAQEVSQRMFASPEAAEGIAAFKEKRPPRWATGAGGR
ncbi:MAG TPA: enoyl-CoA hydratase-related protein [Acidimicrobiales bacterium]|nr:enoyl-CoA hydratase-related protein [Acidimicrobiales bacterium]